MHHGSLHDNSEFDWEECRKTNRRVHHHATMLNLFPGNGCLRTVENIVA